MILLAVVVLLIALAFPFGGTYITEPMSRDKLPATGTPGNILLRYGLSYPCRPSEFERIEQIEAILFILMLAPVVLTDLPSLAFGQWPPAQKRQPLTSINIAYRGHRRAQQNPLYLLVRPAHPLYHFHGILGPPLTAASATLLILLEHRINKICRTGGIGIDKAKQAQLFSIDLPLLRGV